MKFTVYLKDPDTLQDAINDAVKEELLRVLEDDEEREAVAEIRKQNTSEACATWFQYGECVTLEIDTKAMTCVVLPVKR